MLINPSLERYVYGSTIQLMAVPADKKYLNKWVLNKVPSGNASPLDYKVEVPNPNIQAWFAGTSGKATLTLLVDGPGKVEVEPHH